MVQKAVLLTGGSGFLGARIADALRRAPWCSKVMTPSSAEYDLRHEAQVDALLQQTKPDIIIHAAGLVGGVGANHDRPAEFFFDNLMMGSLMLHYAWKHHVTKFVGIGTGCSYPSHAAIPLREEDIWNGRPAEETAPFGIAKRALIEQAATYRKQYGFNAITVILANLYGPQTASGGYHSHAIPCIIEKIADAQKNGSQEVTLWGDGQATRDFLFVDDAAEGVLLATEKYGDPLPLNIATGQEISIADLARIIASVMHFDGTFVWDSTMPTGQLRRCFSVERAENKIGFRAKHSLQEGIKRSVASFLQK